MQTPIPDLYQVKWFQGGWRYGVVDRWSPTSVQYYQEEQRVIVDDATSLQRYVVNVDALTEIPISSNPPDEYHQHVNEQYLIALGRSDALPPGLHVGKMFRTPVGDGYAYYVVTKVNKKTVKIEWRGFSLDRWVDFRFGAGGKEDRELIESLVAREDNIRRLFAPQPQETTA